MVFTFENLHNEINNKTTSRSAWSIGVASYAHDLVHDLAVAVACGDITIQELQHDSFKRRSVVLNGAKDWKEFSQGGCSLWSNGEIAARLCTPSGLKRTNHGLKYPNSRETWLDVQARALYQAYNLLCSAICALA